ncbi:aldo/keto reductase [Catellatospora citrea]|uniref:aldo/keto reductase n=1 Tax=Catellatospora citrea TaxID=53366 RepID=UPI0033C38F24
MRPSVGTAFAGEVSASSGVWSIFFDTSDYYGAASARPGDPVLGFGHNETLLGRALRGRRDEAVIATKFSARPLPEGGSVFDGRPEYVKAACEASLRRPGTDRIDLYYYYYYYYHRLDPTVPIEDTVGAMAELVAEGKVHALGLSEVSAEVLCRAMTVHPISALQSEYSCGSAEWRPRSCRSAATWGSPWCPTAHWAAAPSPGDSPGPAHSAPTTSARPCPNSRATTGGTGSAGCPGPGPIHDIRLNNALTLLVR